MYYGSIKPCDIANGTGVRVTLFVSGCTHRCKGCFQPQTWDFRYGQPFAAGQSRARCEATGALLSLVDVLVDGEFVEALRDISLRFRGSSNQRLLDVPASLAAGRPIPWEG